MRGDQRADTPRGRAGRSGRALADDAQGPRGHYYH